MRKGWWLPVLMLACSDSQSLAERYRAKLRDCGLLSEGKISVGTDEFSTCVTRCVLKESCAALQESLCGDEDSESLLACFDACEFGEAFVCKDGSQNEEEEVHRCDGHVGCDDGSDEKGCPASTYFTCDDGERVPASYQCDDGEDCEDGSDEVDCEHVRGGFQCKTGERTGDDESECDGFEDCEDGSDELRCVERGAAFDCGDDSYVRASSVCDGEDDCKDGSDEEQGCAEFQCSRAR